MIIELKIAENMAVRAAVQEKLKQLETRVRKVIQDIAVYTAENQNGVHDLRLNRLEQELIEVRIQRNLLKSALVQIR